VLGLAERAGYYPEKLYGGPTQRVAIVMVIHDNKVLDIADRVVELEEGRLAGGDQAAAG